MNPVLALGITQIVGYGTLYYAFPILVPGVAQSFGRPEAHLYAVFSLGLLLGGLAAPRAGLLMDRVGAPRLMVAGSLLAALALLVVGTAPNFGIWAIGILAIELVAVAVLYDAAFAALVTLRGEGARRAITRLTLIAGFASTIFWPLTSVLTAEFGWRGTVLAYAVLNATLGAGLHLVLARMRPAQSTVSGAPAPTPVPESAPLPPEMRAAAFRAVAASFALTGAVVMAFGVHMVPILTAAGLGAQAAVVAVLMGPAQVVIRIVDAVFFRRLHPLTVAAVSASALPLATAGLLLGLPPLAAGVLFASFLGIGGGLTSIVRGSVPLALFGQTGYGAQLGRLAFLRTLAASGAPFAFAGLAAGLGQDAALWFFAAIGVVATLPLLALRARLATEGRLAPLL
jgi:MFS family permease